MKGIMECEVTVAEAAWAGGSERALGVSTTGSFSHTHVLGLGVAKAPYLIALDTADLDFPNVFIVKLGASLPSVNQELDNRVHGDANDTGYRPHRGAFNQHVEQLYSLVFRQFVHA